MSAAASELSVDAARAQIAKAWDADVLQTLKEYISIPNQVRRAGPAAAEADLPLGLGRLSREKGDSSAMLAPLCDSRCLSLLACSAV